METNFIFGHCGGDLTAEKARSGAKDNRFKAIMAKIAEAVHTGHTSIPAFAGETVEIKDHIVSKLTGLGYTVVMGELDWMTVSW